ncbi:MAG: hypothetical protein KAW89_06360, partial [Armatimonadetes bacterium]|nr:hypothetical protein [Armatimonadota bacterium]
ALGEQETSGWRWLYNQDLTWESSDPLVGTIDSLGEFAATGLGTTEVTGTYEDLPPDSALVTVVELGPQPTADYYPLDLGYWWEYTGSEVEPGGIRPQQEITLTVTCLRQVVATDEVWYELRVQFTDPQQAPRYMYFQHDDEGLRELYADDSTDYKLVAPIEAGQDWQWVDSVGTQHYCVIESITETVDVPAAPAGGFEDCVKVHEHNVLQDGDEWDIFTWFKAGVGVVKSEYSEEDPDTGEEVWIYQELVDYWAGG